MKKYRGPLHGPEKALFLLALLTSACGGATGGVSTMAEAAGREGSYGADLAFLKHHTDVVLLKDEDGRAQVAVAPQYQGRVMTSTASGADGPSFGYVHREGVANGTRQPHMTVLGGEDRFWLGPEGGQFALYFEPGAPFVLEHWQVPEPIDWGAWPVTAQTDTAVTFQKDMVLTNYAGTQLSLRVERTVRLLDEQAVATALSQAPGANTSVVAYESDNLVTNTGENAWTKQSGAVSIWILGMYNPTPETVVVIPFVRGSDDELGPVVNDRYFGELEAERLKVSDGAIFFRADGQKRSKIGVPKPRAMRVAGAYDPIARVLTIVQYTLPEEAADYVSSMWEHQEKPFSGDVVNSYNDGPLGPGEPPLGPFYEIESSSPALFLEPQATARHVHRTVHLKGPKIELNVIARAQLGVSLQEIERAFSHPSP